MQDETGRVVGATVKDVLGRKSYDVYARQVRSMLSIYSH